MRKATTGEYRSIVINVRAIGEWSATPNVLTMFVQKKITTIVDASII